MSKKPDWEAIEGAYRAGQLSIRNIADKHGVSEGAVRKRAKRNDWQRDLTDKVKGAVRQKLVRTESTQAGTRSGSRTDADIIEQASNQAAAVVLAHRQELASWRALAGKLCFTLSEMDVTEDNHERFARSLNAGVDAQMKVIKGERQAYSLDEAGSGDDDAQPVGAVEITVVGEKATD